MSTRACNPYYFKEITVWRREMPSGSIQGPRFATLCAIAAPALLVWVMSLFDFVERPAEAAWLLSAGAWFIVVSLLAVSAGVSVYTRERDLGALHRSHRLPRGEKFWDAIGARCWWSMRVGPSEGSSSQAGLVALFALSVWAHASNRLHRVLLGE